MVFSFEAQTRTIRDVGLQTVTVYQPYITQGGVLSDICPALASGS